LLRWIRIVLTILIVVLALWWGGQHVAPHILPAVSYVRQLGPLGPVLFILLYVVAMVGLVPGSWLTAAGGAVFGIVPAVCYALVGATLGSTAAFLLGRHAARRLVLRLLESMPRLAAIDRAVSEQGRRLVFLLRLSPVAPFNVLNYALGLTNLSAWDFFWASLGGSIPSTIMFAYAGHLAGAALVWAGQAEVPRGPSYYAILAGGLAATVAATSLVARAARRALQDV
jgi:uncharacterized membrane protein YdjX (TVP38/TMEM64 family)